MDKICIRSTFGLAHRRTHTEIERDTVDDTGRPAIDRSPDPGSHDIGLPLALHAHGEAQLGDVREALGAERCERIERGSLPECTEEQPHVCRIIRTRGIFDGMTPELLPALPPSLGDFTLLTFNVLMPNGVRGWWIEKMYRPETPPAHRAWPHRQRQLAQILLAQRPDIVCLQEMCPDSFEDDTRFLREAGYDSLLHKKFHLRVATFWRPERFVYHSAHHLDRVLATTFLAGSRPLHIVNCHLTTGAHPDKRLRQVHDALQRLVKGGAAPGDAVIVCGDLNAPAPCAVHHLLATGAVGPDFRSYLRPDAPLTSRIRSHPFGEMRDAYVDACGSAVPPSFIAPRLHSWMCRSDGGPSDALLASLREMYTRLLPLDQAGIDRWLSTINGAPHRGSEYDEVQQILATQGSEILSWPQFLGIYRNCLEAGKYWSIDYDLHAYGIQRPSPPSPPFEARLDYVFHSPALGVVAVQEPWSAELRDAVRKEGRALPTAEHPSDHLPLAAAFRWR